MKYFKFVILCFIWSTTWAVIKVGLDQTPPMVGLALRFGVAALILGAAIIWKRRRIVFDRISVQNYFVIGLLTMALSYFCTYWAEKFISSGLTSILWTALPIMVGIFARYMLPNERMSRLQILSVMIALSGVVIILFDQQLIFNSRLLMGGLIALAGVAVSGWPNVFLKTRRQSYDPLTLTAMAMAIGSGIHLIGATVFGEWAKMVWDFKNIGAIVYLGLFGSAIAFFVYYDLLNQISVVKLTFVTFITPVFATLIGAFWLNELVTWREIGGMLLIFAGLVLYDLKKYLAILKQRKGEVAHG